MRPTFKRALHRTSALLPKTARRLIYRAGMFLGGDESFPSIYSTLRYLSSWGFSPDRVVDVGAYEGEWARMIKDVFPEAEVLMVEPQESKAELLRAVSDRFAGVHYRSALLGPVDQQEVVFVEMETGSSVFEEQTPDWFPKVRKTKTTTTLDALAHSVFGQQPISLIKLDVQGYELEVLKGASSSLSSCEFVLMEASVIPVNRGSPSFEEVTSFMAQRGFVLFDVCEIHRRKDHSLWQLDLAFIKRTSRFLPDPVLNAGNWNLKPPQNRS